MSNKVNFLDSIQDKMMGFTSKLQSNKYIMSISEGMMGSMGVLIGGSIINLIVSLPIPGFADFLTSIGVYDTLTIVVLIFQLTAPIMCFNIGYALAKSKKVNQLQAGIISFMSFLLTVPLASTTTGDQAIALNFLNAQNICTAMITALLATSIFAWITNKNIVIKMPDTVPAFVSDSLGAIPAAVITVVPFIVLRGVLAQTAFATFPGLINALIAMPLQSFGNNLGGHMVFLLASSVLWWFGIHNMPVFLVAMMVTMPAMTENIVALMSGQPAPHMLSLMSYLVPSSLIGGPGCLFGLYICTAFFAKSERFKTQGKIQLIPGIFNIIEPAMFGMPIVLNPYFLIPFVLVPQIVMVLMYVGLNMQLFTTPIVNVSTFLPAPIIGFLIGGGIGMGIFILIAVAISTVCYYPFVMMADKKALEEEAEIKNSIIA